MICSTVFSQKAWRPDRQVNLFRSPIDTMNSFRTPPKASSRSNMDEQWNKLASGIIPIGEEAYSIKMVDKNTAWMISSNNLFAPPIETPPNIFRSTDGGSSWDQFQIPSTEGFFGIDIAPVDAMTAYAVLWGPDYFNDLSQDAIYKTTDGGQTWEPNSEYPFAPTFIHFFDAQNGWVMGLDTDFWITMSTTNDGGQTWEHAGGNDWVIPEGKEFPDQDPDEFLATYLNVPSGNYDVESSTIIIGGTSYWISHDEGHNWERLHSPLNMNDDLVHGIVALKDSMTYMFASNTTLDFTFRPAKAYTTTDGGQSWIESNPPINPDAIEYLPGTDNDFIITGLDVGFDPTFGYGITGTARTSNLENWEVIQDIGLNSMDFFGENQGVGAFANFPGFADGTVYSWGEKIVLPFDAAVSRLNEYPFTIVTLNHLEENVLFEYEIQNLGTNDLENAIARLEVFRNDELVFTDSTNLNASLEDPDFFTFSYLPEEVGFFTFRITVDHPEIGAAFFEDFRLLEVSETTLARDNGIATLAFVFDPEVFSSSFGYAGSEFKLLTEDKLTGISAVLDFVQSDSNSLFTFLIKSIDENGNVQEEDIYKSVPIVASEAFTEDFSHVLFPLPEPIVLPAGRYIFAVGQDSPQGKVAFDLTDQTNTAAWRYGLDPNGLPLPWTNFPSDPTLMIRPQFEALMSTNTKEAFSETIPLTVYPIPFQEELNILLEYFEEAEVQLQIFDMSGKLWKNSIVNHHQVIHQNVSALPKGLYILRLTSGKYQKSLKVIKQ